jgi:TM2 domain-containing membrane protein YozV
MDQKVYCPHCGKEVSSTSLFCPYCGGKLKEPIITYNNSRAPRSTLTASLLSIFLGGYGAGNFYLGNTSKAVVQLVLGLLLVTLPISAIWGLVEGIMLMCGKITKDGEGLLLKNDI